VMKYQHQKDLVKWPHSRGIHVAQKQMYFETPPLICTYQMKHTNTHQQHTHIAVDKLIIAAPGHTIIFALFSEASYP